MTTLVAATALALVGQGGSTNILDYVQRNLEDASFLARVKTANQVELKKINDDFGNTYRFKTVTFKVKEPFMLRSEATVDDTTITYILNGSNLLIKIPRARINTRQDLSKAPGRRQTLMDFGVLTPSMFKGDFYTAKYVRHDRATGDVVFDIGYITKLDDTSRHRVWIDPAKKYITRREWYGQRGRQQATFYYTNPISDSGVWMPTQVSVRNNDNKVAGETFYEAIKINTGLADSLFNVK